VKGGGAQETMKDALVTEIRECRNSQEEDIRGFPCSFPFRAWTTKHLVASDGASQLACVALHHLIFLVQQLE
jgi:hypothetical protein